MESNRLSEEERIRIGLLAERVHELLAAQHGVSMHQVADAVRYIEQHRAWMESMKRSGLIALIGFLASALLLTLWEGVKQVLRRAS